MKFGVIVFPGSNCDEDLVGVLTNLNAGEVVKLWHKDTNLQDCTHIFVPGGFSYGDYLRSGAIAKLSPIMDSVVNHANNGGFVLGICNGFQILCESGLLPGALLRNTSMKFVCKNVNLITANYNTAITNDIPEGKALTIPIAHGEGRYYADAEILERIENNGQVVFRYCDESGNVNTESNPNGSLNNIAGICNESKNVFGMMPHPERCAHSDLSNTDGDMLFSSLLKELITA